MRGCAAAVLLLFPAVLGAAKPLPPSPPSYVHNEGVVSRDCESRLSRALEGVERRTGRQFALALFRSLEGESLEDYSNKLFRAWRIGSAKRDDGLLFCLFLAERRWRVEVGYGLEGTITDAEAARIAREGGVPRFREGDFDGGVEAVVAGLGARLEGKPPPAPEEGPRGVLIGSMLLCGFVLWLVLLLRLRRAAMPYGIGRRGAGTSWGGGGGFEGFSGGGGGFSGGGGSSGGGGASGGW
jgi:uncharacterized protein